MDIFMQIAELRQGVQMANESRRRIVQLDEFMLTKSTMLKSAWSLKNSNIEIGMKQISDPPRACIVAASAENGVEHFESFEKSINKVKFKQFLDHLREKWPHDQVTLMFDNLSLHIAKDVRAKMEMLGFAFITTPKCTSPIPFLTLSLI